MPKKKTKPKKETFSKELELLRSQNAKFKELIEILSRGKYMWESTFDAINSPVQIVSSDFVIARANLALARTCKKDITKIIGKKCFEEFAERKKPCEGCPLSDARKRDCQIVRVIDNKIAEREFEVSAYPTLSGAMSDLTVMYYRDVTEEKRLQKEVIQQEKMAAIGMLAGGVAHEINNPLGGIIAFTQLLKRDFSSDNKLSEDLLAIEEAALRCKKIVADLLDFSRTSANDEKKPVDINVILEKVFPFIRREMQSLNVELIFDGAGRLPYVLGMPDRLQQVFINLMTNACHAMPKGGTLTVTTKTEHYGEIVVVLVKDTGTGIAESVRDQIFNPFFTTKEPGKGTGLGLSISYRIIKEHGGTIHFEDVRGGGTMFVVKLPATIS